MHKNKKDEATSKKNKNKKDEATSKKNKKNPAAKRKTQQPQQRQAPKSIPREPAGGGGRDAKSSCSWAKAVPNAACCIVPPTDKWEAIQELRARFDKSYERWPPHLTLLFPFLPPGQFRAAAEQLRQDHRFASFHPFTVCLDRLLPPATSRSKYISFHVSESNEGDPLRSTNTKTKATADTSFVPEEEQEEEDLEEEEDCFVPTPKKRSKLGGASGRCPPTRTKPQKQQKKKRKSGTRIQTLSAAPINELPDIFNDVMKALPASQQNYYDIYEVQNLVVASALDIATFGGPDAYQRLVEHVVQVVTNNEKYCKHGSGSGESVEKDAEVLRRYNEYMDSAEQKKKRSYRNDPQSRHVWTPEEIERFKVAFKKYGYGPTSNRKIANYIGGNVHPNHVSYFKHQYKRMLKQQEKEKANNPHHPT